MRCIVALFSIISLVVASHLATYDGFKVYQVTPSNQKELDLLDTLADDSDYDFWSHGRGIDQIVDVMVSPSAQTNFEDLLQENNIPFKTLIDNVERVFQQERISQIIAPKAAPGQITFTKYHNYNEIQTYLHHIERNYPKIVKLHTAGKSVLGRDITVVKISTDPQANKPVIFIDAGIHAREWIAPATALYVIKELVQSENNRHLLEHADWHILPLLNPDGYEYSYTTERLWRKNRSLNGASSCKGVDLNRNFGYYWGGLGTSSNPCRDIYRGPKAFSEPETQALRDHILNIHDRTKLYLSFHNYGQYVLHPWGWGYELPKDAPELNRLGTKVAESIKAVYNTKYRVGSVTQLYLSPGAGGSDDWAKGGANITYSYTLELPGGGSWGYDLPASLITKVVTETFEGVKTFHDYLIEQTRLN